LALETLKGIEQFGDFKVLAERPKLENGEVDWKKFDEQRKDAPIYVDHEVNMISFRIQNGPVKQNGVNGCQVDTLIHAAHEIIMGLNKNFPCAENNLAIAHLRNALLELNNRKLDRTKRGVEGFNKA